jgi:hypothetical protein
MNNLEYLQLDNTKSYLSKIPNEILMLIYDYIDINLNPLIKYINDMQTKFSNKEIFNYFYRWDYIRIDFKLPKIHPTYDHNKIYKIPSSYWTINSTLDNIKVIPLFYRQIKQFTKKYDGVTIFEKHFLEDIFGYGYTNSYNKKFKYNKLKNNCSYTCRESVLLALLFHNINYEFDGIQLKFFSTRTRKITKQNLLDYGFIQVN